MKPRAILAIAFAVLMAAPAACQLNNPDFETGDLTGWSFNGFANAQVTGERSGLEPFNGGFMFSEVISGFSSDARIWQTHLLQPGTYIFGAMFQAETTNALVYEPGYVNPNAYMHSKSTAGIRVDLDGTTNWDAAERWINGIATGFLWKPYAISFTLDAPKSVSLFLISAQSDNWGGHWTAIDSASLTRVEPAAGPASPLLVNGDFESQMSGWSSYGSGGGTEGGYFGITPCQGSASWHAVSSGGDMRAGAYQTFTLTPGTYTVRACAQAASSKCKFEYKAGQASSAGCPFFNTGPPAAFVSLRVDLDGGSDPDNYSVSSGQFETGFKWQNIDVTFRVNRTGPVTIFLDADGAPAGYAGSWTAFDNVALTGPANPAPDATLGAFRKLADGTKVTVPEAIVTADALDIGAAYVQTPDRSSGIRVKPLADPNYHVNGEVASVSGYLSTMPGGERFLNNAVVSPVDSTEPPRPLVMRNRSVAAALPDNVGLLVRSAGVVTSVGDNFVFITDASGSGLRVDLSSLPGSAYFVGQWLDVSGISRLEAADGLFLGQPVIQPRFTSDVQPLN